LQNETRWIPLADRIRLIDLPTDAGLPKIEAASFVSPKWVPQTEDAADVMAGIRRGKSVYAASTYRFAVTARASPSVPSMGSRHPRSKHI
jgi:hydroxymethylglutaryl-CoA lyase